MDLLEFVCYLSMSDFIDAFVKTKIEDRLFHKKTIGQQLEKKMENK